MFINKKSRAYKKQRLKLKKFQRSVSSTLPQSEVWFQSLYESHKLKLNSDKYNAIFWNKYLPDVLNNTFKYVVEIDGSIHDLGQVKFRDKLKDRFYRSHKFQVFRIRHNNLSDYANFVYGVSKLRKMKLTEEFIEWKNLSFGDRKK